MIITFQRHRKLIVIISVLILMAGCKSMNCGCPMAIEKNEAKQLKLEKDNTALQTKGRQKNKCTFLSGD